MSKGQGIASLEVGGNKLLVDLGLGLVGGEDHDNVGLGGSLCHIHDLQAGLGSLLCRGRALAQTHADVAARVHEVQGMCVTLRTIANDGNLFILNNFGVAVVLVVDRYCHVVISFGRRLLIDMLVRCGLSIRLLADKPRIGGLGIVAAAHGNHAGARELANSVAAEEVFHSIKLA